MSFNVVVESEAEEDLKEAAHWIAQQSPDKATLWYFDVEDETVYVLRVRHQAQDVLKPDEGA